MWANSRPKVEAVFLPTSRAEFASSTQLNLLLLLLDFLLLLMLILVAFLSIVLCNIREPEYTRRKLFSHMPSCAHLVHTLESLLLSDRMYNCMYKRVCIATFVFSKGA